MYGVGVQVGRRRGGLYGQRGRWTKRMQSLEVLDERHAAKKRGQNSDWTLLVEEDQGRRICGIVGLRGRVKQIFFR